MKTFNITIQTFKIPEKTPKEKKQGEITVIIRDRTISTEF